MNSLRIKFTDDTKLLDVVNTNQDRDIIQRESRGGGNGKSQKLDLPIEICEGGFYAPTDNNGNPLTDEPKAVYIWSVKGWSGEITTISAKR